MKLVRFYLIFSFLSLSLSLNAQKLTICSQNLHNFGAERGPAIREVRATLLSERIAKAKCDIVAVQELTAKRMDHAKSVCNKLIEKLANQTNSKWECVIGDLGEGQHRLAFLFKTKNLSVTEAISHINAPIPKLSKIDKPSTFQRPPLEAVFQFKSQKISRRLAIFNIHLKSKSGGEKDPTSLKWEIQRMEQAEAIRSLALNRSVKSQIPVLIAGDRNSNFNSPTAKILTGELTLKDFSELAPCRVTSKLIPVCKRDVIKPPFFVSPIILDKSNLSIGGTFSYKKKLEFLDDILIDVKSLGLVQKHHFSLKEFNSGILFEPSEASDHALVWVRLSF